jgi:hypothetical protein
MTSKFLGGTSVFPVQFEKLDNLVDPIPFAFDKDNPPMK